MGKPKSNAAAFEAALASPAATRRDVTEALAALAVKPRPAARPMSEVDNERPPPSWWKCYHARILRPKEVQRALGCGHTTFYDLILRGELPKPLRYGGITGHLAEEIDVFIQKLVAQRDAERALAAQGEAVPADDQVSRSAPMAPTDSAQRRRRRERVSDAATGFEDG